MVLRRFRSASALFGIGAALLVAPFVASKAGAQQAWRFHLEEATIADVHRAIRAKQITAEQLVILYFKRIEAYNGVCVKGEVDPATGLMFGDLTPIASRHKVSVPMLLLEIPAATGKWNFE